MPIKEYKCKDCFMNFEVLLIRVEDVPSCPRCGSKELWPMISASNFKLNGGGWAKDGYCKTDGGKKN
jgi:putative FmdB family regulatory protein